MAINSVCVLGLLEGSLTGHISGTDALSPLLSPRTDTTTTPTSGGAGNANAPYFCAVVCPALRTVQILKVISNFNETDHKSQGHDFCWSFVLHIALMVTISCNKVEVYCSDVFQWVGHWTTSSEVYATNNFTE